MSFVAISAGFALKTSVKVQHILLQKLLVWKVV